MLSRGLKTRSHASCRVPRRRRTWRPSRAANGRTASGRSRCVTRRVCCWSSPRQSAPNLRKPQRRMSSAHSLDGAPTRSAVRRSGFAAGWGRRCRRNVRTSGTAGSPRGSGPVDGSRPCPGGVDALDIISGFRLHPIVGVSERRPQLTPAAREVARILEPAVDALMAPECVVHARRARDGVTLTVPGFHLEGVEIWGATAMVLAEFLSLLGWSSPKRF